MTDKKLDGIEYDGSCDEQICDVDQCPKFIRNQNGVTQENSTPSWLEKWELKKPIGNDGNTGT